MDLLHSHKESIQWAVNVPHEIVLCWGTAHLAEITAYQNCYNKYTNSAYRQELLHAKVNGPLRDSYKHSCSTQILNYQASYGGEYETYKAKKTPLARGLMFSLSLLYNQHATLSNRLSPAHWVDSLLWGCTPWSIVYFYIYSLWECIVFYILLLLIFTTNTSTMRVRHDYYLNTLLWYSILFGNLIRDIGHPFIRCQYFGPINLPHIFWETNFTFAYCGNSYLINALKSDKTWESFHIN